MVLPKVTIEQGTLRGSTATDIRKNTFYKFQGIPYAKPPLGELRFKAPVPSEKWTGVLDATKEREACYQKDIFNNDGYFGSEDCLYLNIYTKKLPQHGTELQPVMFWIHGGRFVAGSGSENLYGPEFLITQGVVLVTINYRLGLLGFVNFDDPSLEVPGNAGLKDQVLALQWVQKNITSFGGDPSNVTIFGEGAGGASVHLLVLSPSAKGLFHKAIAQSGCALNPWVRGTKGTKRIATAMGLEGVDEKIIYSTLMAKTVEELYAIQEKTVDNLAVSEIRPFGLVLENNSKKPFLEEEPFVIMSSGKFTQVPFIIGYTLNETEYYKIFKKLENLELTNFEKTIPWHFEYKYGSPEAEAVVKKISKFYFDNEEYSGKIEKFDLWSDCHFIYGIYITVTTQAKVSKKPIYLYRVTVETDLNLFKSNAARTPGTFHSNDVNHLFENFATPKIRRGSVEDISVSRFVKLWTNFANYGNPTPEDPNDVLNIVWKPVSGEDLDFLDIGQHLVPMTNPDHERINFWKKLFAESPAGTKMQ